MCTANSVVMESLSLIVNRGIKRGSICNDVVFIITAIATEVNATE